MKNIDISKYKKEGFDSWQIKEIKKGLDRNLNVSLYAKEDFDYMQMMEIREGLEQNIDVSKYALKNIKSTCMKRIKEQLIQGNKISFCNTCFVDENKNVSKKINNKSTSIQKSQNILDQELENKSFTNCHSCCDSHEKTIGRLWTVIVIMLILKLSAFIWLMVKFT